MNRILKYLLGLFFLIVFTISSPIRNGLSNIFEIRPISEATIEELQKHKETFTHYANKYEIPEYVIIASIGSEINRRIFINRFTDYFQDSFFNSKLCSQRFLNILVTVKKEFNVMQHDIGLGNISYNTAWTLFQKHREEFPLIKTKKDMSNYLLTNEGNIHVASLVIKEGKSLFDMYYEKMDTLSRNAVLFSYYKQGDKYYTRYVQNSMLKRAPIPGGGKEILKKIKKLY